MSIDVIMLFESNMSIEQVVDGVIKCCEPDVLEFELVVDEVNEDDKHFISFSCC
jgi:hypothetical protein